MKLRLFISIFAFSSCSILDPDSPSPSTDPEVEFNAIPVTSSLNVNHLKEVSGIVPSIKYPNHLWLIEDSDTEPKIDLLRNDGTYIRKVTFNGRNRDWEGLAIGPGPEPSKNYIYIGEIGDNNIVFQDYFIYRFEEPDVDNPQINNYETIRFRYPNNESLNSETLLVDPLKKDIYIITKDQINVRIYKLSYPQNTQDINQAEFQGTIKYWGIVGGDISADGTEIILKSYPAVYYWKIKKNESIYQTLSRPHDVSPSYVIEPQGEAICWDNLSRGFYTISEKNGNAIPPLYYYSKK